MRGGVIKFEGICLIRPGIHLVANVAAKSWSLMLNEVGYTASCESASHGTGTPGYI